MINLLNDYEELMTQIYSLLEMHRIQCASEGDRKRQCIEYDDDPLTLKKVNKVGRPRLIDADDRKIARQERLKAEKYSTRYYNEHKSRVSCQYCNKEINSLAKSSHYKSKSCIASRDVFREEPRILTSRLG